MRKLFLSSPLILFFVFIICVRWFSIFFMAFDSGEFNHHMAVHETGELAWKLLMFMILISLFQKIWKIHFPKHTFFDSLLPLRKWAGVFAFLIVASHSASEILKRGFSVENIWNTVFTTHHAAILGAASFLVMLPLFLTSTKWATNRMGPKSWKALQRFSHLAFLLAGMHIALIEFFGKGRIEVEPLFVLGVYGIGYLYLFLKKKKYRP